MNKNAKRLVKESVVTVTDFETGYVDTETIYRTSYLPPEPAFVKLYLDFILDYKKLPNGMNRVLLALLKQMTYKNVIVVNKGIKEDIAEELGVKVNYISNCLTDFTKNNILIRVKTGYYHVNAELFGKGKWQDIHKIREIQAQLIFNEDGQKIQEVNIIGDEDNEENGNNSQDIAS